MIILVLLSARMMTATTSWNLLNFFKSSWISWWTALSTSQRRDLGGNTMTTATCTNSDLLQCSVTQNGGRKHIRTTTEQCAPATTPTRATTSPSPVGRVAPWWWPLLEVCKSHHICMSLEKCPFIPNANAFLFDWLSEISIRCFLFSANYACVTMLEKWPLLLFLYNIYE